MMMQRFRILNKNKLLLLAIFALYLIIPLIIYAKYFISGHVMVSGDGDSYLNSKSMFAYSLLNGDLPLWNRFGMLGTPYLADVQTSFFYPLSYLALLMPINVFSNVFYIISIALGGFFMYLYMNEMQENKLVSFITGLAFMFSTILGGERVVHQNIYSTIIWFPLILFFIQRYIQTNSKKELFFAAIAMAVQFMAGFPQVAIYSNIYIFLYLIVFMKKSKETIKKSLLDIFVWLVAFIMLITIQLLPLAELINDTGRDSISYSFFASFSADYKILPMMVYPELFNNIYSPFGEFQSTGVDIEIYLGIVAVVFLLYAMIFHLKDKRIRTFLIFGMLALLYCMLGNIPVLGKLVWKIPILGSFRVQSRILFVYVFFTIVIFGMILSKIKDRTEARRLLKLSLVVLTVLVLITIVVKSLSSSQMASDEMRKYFSGVSVFMPALIVILCLIGSLAVYCYMKFFYNKKYAYRAFALAICIVSLIDVSRYSLKHANIDYIGNMESQANSQIEYIENQEHSNQYRSIAAFVTGEQLYSSAGLSAYRYNGNMYYRRNSYNAYLTFESTKTKNFIGLENAILMPNINSLVHQNNAKLSAASIKYIVDPLRNITKEHVISGIGEILIEIPDTIILSNNSVVNVQNSIIDINNNEQYFIQFNATTQKSPKIFYIDFYRENYNLDEYRVSFALQSGTNIYSGLINTGIGTLPDEAYVRIVSQSDLDIEISNFKVYKIQSVPFDSVYKTLLSNGDIIIYENVNAKPIINVAEKIADISQYNDFEVNTTSFIENPIIKAVGNNAQVDILEIKNNSIKAKITAAEEVFINHTQVMYPGWNAYVDGIRVQNYLVNKTYQGTYVPAGEHMLEFRFEPLSLYIGAAVTAAGIVLIVILIRRENIKKSKIDKN